MKTFFKSKSMPDIYGLKRYYDDVAKNHCPFARPAFQEQKSLYSLYPIPSGKDSYLFKRIFFTVLIHFELLRIQRLKNLNDNKIFLLTENIGFGSPESNSLKYEFDWIHWFMKILYTTKGWAFGKFWLGEKLDNKHGIPIPPPPINLFTMRSLLKPNDSRFFEKTPELVSDYLNSIDDLSNVIEYQNDFSKIENISDVQDLVSSFIENNLFSEILIRVDRKEKEIGKQITLKKFKYV